MIGVPDTAEMKISKKMEFERSRQRDLISTVECRLLMCGRAIGLPVPTRNDIEITLELKFDSNLKAMENC